MGTSRRPVTSSIAGVDSRSAIAVSAMGFTGHLWTIGSLARRRLRPTPPPPTRRWRSALVDPVIGRIRLSGLLTVVERARELLLVVHGLGGSGESDYAIRAARAAEAAGVDCLRVHLRGADRRGYDIHHAALTDDLHHTLGAPELSGYERIYVLGYSLGGHLALHFAAECVDERLEAVAAVCAPLDLDAGARLLDSAAGWPYRRYVLESLFEIYDAFAARHPERARAAEVRSSRTLREFDGRAVAPRHGFADAEEYYRLASVGPRLPEIRVPTIFLAAPGDPMVPAASLPRFLERAPEGFEVRWLHPGGHVAFPKDLDLGRPAPTGLEPQLLDWLRSR